MSAPSRHAGRVAVVTGAAQGIGLASARRLASEGAAVALLDQRESVVEVADGLRQAGATTSAWVVDVSDEPSVTRTFDGILARHGAMSLLHSSAGILLPAPATRESLDRWERTYAVNVRGMFLVARTALKIMLDADLGSGSVVLTGSISGLVAEPDFLAYCTSKAAVNHMARQLALDHAAHGIRVNAVCPGWVSTSFSDELLAGMSEQEIVTLVRDQVPLGRQGTPEEVAAAVSFLLSDEAAYITGHLLVMDGGLTIR